MHVHRRTICKTTKDTSRSIYYVRNLNLRRQNVDKVCRQFYGNVL